MNVATFYRFVRIDDPQWLAAELRASAGTYGLRGTILLAYEGINATIAGTDADIREFLAVMRRDERFADLPVRHSRGDPDNAIFYRLKVRVRDELIAMQRPEVDPVRRTGVHVDAAAWNRLLDDPAVTVIDARNRYEIDLGTFPGAVNPGTRSFKELPAFIDRLHPAQHQRLALFCTGGIRCEKATAYALERGHAEVVQLDGGILNYLDTVGAANRFVGECFVFDQRVSVDDDLAQGRHRTCHACRHVLSEIDLASPEYVVDVSCPYCVGRQTPTQRAGFAERARQSALASSRGERHVGAEMQKARSRSRRTR